MKAQPSAGLGPRLTLCAETAADLMTTNPVSIGADATLEEAVAFLANKGFSAAAVIDQAGRPIGVVSQLDIVVFHAIPEYHAKSGLGARSAERLKSGGGPMAADRTCVREVMTPIVFSVTPELPAHKVIEEMLARKVHRLFVVGNDGVLTGVISTVDFLRCLRAE
jgi:CBS domain-containing protein